MTMKRSAGFTLIELMIVVAVVAIIAAIALPSYQDQVRSSNRADGQAALMGLAQAMERHFTETGSYTGAGTGGADTGAPAIFSAKAPIDGSSTFYNLTIDSASDSSYVLKATAVNGQAEDGDMELTSSGLRRWDRGDDGTMDNPGDLCWSRKC
ncbi:type IV pilin protein [Biformimicrobium ophioploci]|uniref:Type IV pilin protein n=1 Tax=Biformimicrobium ophioploci TaxID=3036711 RepID=A0ABQ6M2N0_9GAMM|nr:type IV pilin protein [Microbulbifer sp. NKW57]GMG88576.1 type IV pilin protein [Microbulbifer sp. NKW57]